MCVVSGMHALLCVRIWVGKELERHTQTVLSVDHGFGGMGKVQKFTFYFILAILFDVLRIIFQCLKRKILLTLKIPVNGIDYEMKPDAVKL